MEADAKENPFNTPSIKMENQYGVTLDYPVGELMDKKVTPENRILSEASIYRMIFQAFEIALKQTENIVTVLSGGAETVVDSKTDDGKKTIYKPVQKIISKE